MEEPNDDTVALLGMALDAMALFLYATSTLLCAASHLYAHVQPRHPVL